MTDTPPSFPLEEAERLTVLVADDHALMREGIIHALAQALDITVLAEAADGLATLAAIERQKPDVCLLDLHMPRMDGLTCLDQIVARWPDLPVLILSMEESREVALEAMARGAAGYVMKTIHPVDLAAMVRQAARKQVLFGGRAAPEPAAPPAPVLPALDDLTRREREILALLCEGRTNKEIAAHLFVTTKTVKYHLTNVFAKLGVTNRTEACVLALKHRIV